MFHLFRKRLQNRPQPSMIYPCFLPATCGRKETRVYHQIVFSIPPLYMEPVVFPAQIFIQVLISGIFMREIAYTDSVFLL